MYDSGSIARARARTCTFCFPWKGFGKRRKASRKDAMHNRGRVPRFRGEHSLRAKRREICIKIRGTSPPRARTSSSKALDYRPWRATEAQGDLGSARADTPLSPPALLLRGVSLSNNASREQYNGPHISRALRKLSLPRGEEDGGNATRGKFRYVSLIREGGMDKRHRRELSIYRGTKCKVE